MTIDYEPITPPGRLDALQELRLPVDMLRWAPSLLTMKARRTVHPRTAILLPGFGAGPRSMRVMESFLRRRGHRVRDWGLGVNNGDARKFRVQLESIVGESIAAYGEPVVGDQRGHLAQRVGLDQRGVAVHRVGVGRQQRDAVGHAQFVGGDHALADIG